MIETTVSVPLLADNADGSQSVVGVEKRTVMVKATLSFDEFVADMWLKGVRFGIDAAGVKEMINGGKSGRILIANPMQPMDGSDAKLKEQSEKLHRDDTPRVLSSGAIDLTQFKNRFPQIKKGERLLKKQPRVLGEPGMDIAGHLIEAPLPEDFDLADLVGEGTRIERTAEGDFIAATTDGFLNMDTTTNRIAVMEKIVNFSGINIRTTGDIQLEGDYFEEHGEIQEKRVVEGKSITVMADVFGKVVSSGGAIVLKQNLMGGAALNKDGNITVEGLASTAELHAEHGTITVARAENSYLTGMRVVMESAVSCTIVAESIEIKSAIGCVIAGKRLKLGCVQSRKDDPTSISVLLPDPAGLKEKIGIYKQQIADVDKKIDVLRHRAQSVTDNPEVKNYLVIAGKVQRKELTLTPEQKASLQKMAMRVLPALKATSAVNAEIQKLREEQTALKGKIDALIQASRQASGSIHCAIEHTGPGTRIRKMYADIHVLFGMPPKDLKLRLLDPGHAEDRLSVHEEAFTWRPS